MLFLSSTKILQKASPSPPVLNSLGFTLCLPLYLDRTLPAYKAGFSLLFYCANAMLGAHFLCIRVTFSLATSTPFCIEPLPTWFPSQAASLPCQRLVMAATSGLTISPSPLPTEAHYSPPSHKHIVLLKAITCQHYNGAKNS